MFKRIFRKYSFLAALVFLVILGTVCFLAVFTNGGFSLTGQLMNQQKVVAKAEASNIQLFFDKFGDSLAATSQLKGIRTPAANTVALLTSFVEQWSKTGIVGGVTMTNADGLVTYNVNVTGVNDTGGSLTDRDFFVWARDKAKDGEHFIGQSVISKVGASKGQYIVPVAAALFRDGKFAGVLVSAVQISPLTEYYLGTLKISESTSVYIIGKDGYILYNGAEQGNIGLSIFEVRYESPFSENSKLSARIKKDLSKAEAGSLTANYTDPKTGVYGPHLVAYSPVVFPNRNWLVVLASPIEQTIAKSPILFRRLATLVFGCMTFAIVALLVLNYAKRLNKKNK